MSGMWPHDTFPTKSGGHTYLGFVTEREGIVKPVPAENFEFLTEKDQESLRKGFAEKGYKLIRNVDDEEIIDLSALTGDGLAPIKASMDKEELGYIRRYLSHPLLNPILWPLGRLK